MPEAGRRGLIWLALALILGAPVLAATFSPYLAWRSPVYILAGFAGIVALALLPMQPLVMAGALPGLSQVTARKVHRWIGGAVTGFVLIHVGGLWMTSPPDVIDALLFRSPTSFSIWGVLAMWAIIVSAVLGAARQTGRIRWRVWRVAHIPLALVAVGGPVIHAVLIVGTMEPASKVALCAFAVIASGALVLKLARDSRQSG